MLARLSVRSPFVNLQRAAVGVLVVAMSTATTVFAAAAAQPAEKHRVPPTIDGAGNTDVTAQLQQFIDSVPDGSVVEFPRGARYRVDGTIQLRSRANLTFEGNRATIFAATTGARDRAQWAITGGSRLVFRNLVVRGANPEGGIGDAAYREDLAFQHGFTLGGVDGLDLDHVTVSDVYGDFVYVGPDKAGTWSQNVWIHDSIFTRNGRQGIAITAGRNVVIERNRISNTRRSTFDFEPNTKRGGAENIHVLSNEVGRGRLLFVASHGNGPVNDVVITGNKLDRVLSVDVKSPGGDRRSRFWVTGNKSSTPADHRPMLFIRVDSVVVSDNVQPVNRKGQAGVGLDDVCGARVEGNDFGSGTPATDGSGDRCHREVPANPPRAPLLPGRAGKGTGGTSSPSTAATPSTSVPARTSTRATPANGSDSGSVAPWILGGAAAVLVAGGALAAFVRYRARASRGG
jgi:hypothetical protein